MTPSKMEPLKTHFENYVSLWGPAEDTQSLVGSSAGLLPLLFRGLLIKAEH